MWWWNEAVQECIKRKKALPRKSEEQRHQTKGTYEDLYDRLITKEGKMDVYR